MAQRLEVTLQAVLDILAGQSARVPASLEKLLEAVGLQLVVAPTTGGESGSRV